MMVGLTLMGYAQKGKEMALTSIWFYRLLDPRIDQVPKYTE